MAIDNIDFIESSPGGEAPLSEVALRLHPQDHVAIAKINLCLFTIIEFKPQDIFFYIFSLLNS